MCLTYYECFLLLQALNDIDFENFTEEDDYIKLANRLSEYLKLRG